MKMASKRHDVEQGRKRGLVGCEGFSFCGDGSPISARLSSAEADVTELGCNCNHSKADGTVLWIGFLTCTGTN